MSNSLARELPAEKIRYPGERLKVIASRSHAGDVFKVAEASFGDVEKIVAAGSGYKTLQVRVCVRE